MRATLTALLALALIAACGPPDGDVGSSSTIAEHAEPLLAAHDVLVAHSDAAEDDLAAALDDWPESRDRIDGLLDGAADPEGSELAPRDRSTLVGFRRGLDVAVGAWDDAHTLFADGDTEQAGDAAGRARQRMEHLARLRGGLPDAAGP